MQEAPGWVSRSAFLESSQVIWMLFIWKPYVRDAFLIVPLDCYECVLFVFCCFCSLVPSMCLWWWFSKLGSKVLRGLWCKMKFKKRQSLYSACCNRTRPHYPSWHPLFTGLSRDSEPRSLAAGSLKKNCHRAVSYSGVLRWVATASPGPVIETLGVKLALTLLNLRLGLGETVC